MEQAGLKYKQLRKFVYLQEKAFEIYTSSGNGVFICHNPKGVKSLIRLRLREQKFKHDFLDMVFQSGQFG